MCDNQTRLILDASGTLGVELDSGKVITTMLVEVTVEVKTDLVVTELDTPVESETLVDDSTLDPDHDTPLPEELDLGYGG